ncbi:UDP-N-acetyl-D-mannosamine dehydrogenase [Sphingomonas sp. PB2P19]|uniref:UDP-N-acetyl-D-mannosamine dehydrogenase n=1 Tax=Sphingomonas rhamnosi TaxID=3096156 RepID=UPI002FC5FDA3
MKVCIVGLGYIGLPTAAVIAGRGIQVVGLDVSQVAVDAVNAGRPHIVEPGLPELVADVVQKGHLRATVTPEPADVFVVAVPTPFTEDRQPDLKYISSAIRTIAPLVEPGNLIILESTSPVGATEQMARWLAEVRPDLKLPLGEAAGQAEVRIAHCPERVLPGKIIRELVENDRVIGGLSPACSETARDFYRSFVEGECIVTDARTAEMCKLAENSFRDVNIAYANEMSVICDRLGIDVWELIALANRHPRVNILSPGPGVGGHCIAVDPWFIVASAPDQARLIRTARNVNDDKEQWVIDRVADRLAGKDAAGGRATVACYGLAFKPDIDDLRESPAVAITRRLSEMFGDRVIAVEPNIDEMPAQLAAVRLVDLETALDTADLHVLLVDHQPFRALARERLADLDIIDTRGAWLR